MDKYDLFRVLKKSSFEEVSRALRKALLQPDPAGYPAARRSIIEEHGWSEDEVFVEDQRRHELYLEELTTQMSAEITKEIDDGIVKDMLAMMKLARKSNG